ncbi:MAG TPA: HEAT repeat domain-containing protein [Candidatus Nitrosopolaris sp.]|nr:HEAT repeat domain-containing protein [Candidatus Nitrosopolaris sp.]
MREQAPEPSETSWAFLMADRYSQELQLRRASEDEGNGAAIVAYVESGVFEGEPVDAVRLYSAMAASSDPEVRKAVVERLDKLHRLDEEGAQLLEMMLISDTDPEVKRLAYIAWNQYG